LRHAKASPVLGMPHIWRDYPASACLVCLSMSSSVATIGNCFLTEEDYTAYTQDLLDASAHCQCAIHAYVLMTNHVHLLVTGREHNSISRMMQRLGRHYVACFNARYRRTGTLWEGRFKSSLVDTKRYLLTCYRYIELNPVRAAMGAHPRDYRWSSFSCNADGRPDPLAKPHGAYLALGETPVARRNAYRALFASAISDDDMANIRSHVQRQKALGDSRFQAWIEAMVHQGVAIRPRGRPKKQDQSLDKAARKRPLPLK